MRILRLTLALILCGATLAHAGITNLKWNACLGDGGVVNRNFACDTNTGSEQLIASFIPEAPVDSVFQMNAVVRISFPAPVPPWWLFRSTGTCRSSALAISTIPPASASACIDWANGGRDGLTTYTIGGFFGANSAQISVLSPFQVAAPFDLLAGQEYFAFAAVISHQKTVGAGACAGCVMGACMGFVGVRLFHAPGRFDTVVSPVTPIDQVATWQGGAGIAIPNYGGSGFTFCPGATPVRNRTWGDVKASYR